VNHHDEPAGGMIFKLKWKSGGPGRAMSNDTSAPHCGTVFSGWIEIVAGTGHRESDERRASQQAIASVESDKADAPARTLQRENRNLRQ
jgi:hypothetical protein